MMASNPDQTITIIEKLNGLRSRLSSGGDTHAQSEALRLSRQLTTSLEKPENTAVDLAFSVSPPPPAGFTRSST